MLAESARLMCCIPALPVASLYPHPIASSVLVVDPDSLRIAIYSTLGDCHYVGLDGLEVTDSDGNVVDTELRVSSTPHSVGGGDPRTPSKLLNGEVGDDVAGRAWVFMCLVCAFVCVLGGVGGWFVALKWFICSKFDMLRAAWLVPYDREHPPEIFLLFERPIILGTIAFWNYSKVCVRVCMCACVCACCCAFPWTLARS